MSEYRRFLEAKIKLAGTQGFEVEPGQINPALKDFAREARLIGAAG